MYYCINECNRALCNTVPALTIHQGINDDSGK